MRIKELFETPLPDDWDHDIYNDRIPFSKRVRYAKERAMQMGVGSSRIAFKIPYQGRDTVIKLSRNKKGQAQNEVEADLLSEGLIQHIGITIPLIDYDTENNAPTWIHTEFAEKIRPNQMKQFTNGLDLMSFIECAAYESGSHDNITYQNKSITNSFDSEIDRYNLNDLDFYHQVKELVGNYRGVVVWRDLTVLRNWGLYRGSPVVIDLGLSEDVYKTHYT